MENSNAGALNTDLPLPLLPGHEITIHFNITSGFNSRITIEDNPQNALSFTFKPDLRGPNYEMNKLLLAVSRHTRFSMVEANTNYTFQISQKHRLTFKHKLSHYEVSIDGNLVHMQDNKLLQSDRETRYTKIVSSDVLVYGACITKDSLEDSRTRMQMTRSKIDLDKTTNEPKINCSNLPQMNITESRILSLQPASDIENKIVQDGIITDSLKAYILGDIRRAEADLVIRRFVEIDQNKDQNTVISTILYIYVPSELETDEFAYGTLVYAYRKVVLQKRYDFKIYDDCSFWKKLLAIPCGINVSKTENPYTQEEVNHLATCQLEMTTIEEMRKNLMKQIDEELKVLN